MWGSEDNSVLNRQNYLIELSIVSRNIGGAIGGGYRKNGVGVKNIYIKVAKFSSLPHMQS